MSERSERVVDRATRRRRSVWRPAWPRSEPQRTPPPPRTRRLRRPPSGDSPGTKRSGWGRRELRGGIRGRIGRRADRPWARNVVRRPRRCRPGRCRIGRRRIGRPGTRSGRIHPDPRQNSPRLARGSVARRIHPDLQILSAPLPADVGGESSGGVPVGRSRQRPPRGPRQRRELLAAMALLLRRSLKGHTPPPAEEPPPRHGLLCRSGSRSPPSSRFAPSTSPYAPSSLRGRARSRFPITGADVGDHRRPRESAMPPVLKDRRQRRSTCRKSSRTERRRFRDDRR